MDDKQWVQSYKEALLELDSTQLGKRVETAELAIRDRLASLQQQTGNHSGELQSLADAMQNLGVLRRELNRKTAGTSPVNPV